MEKFIWTVAQPFSIQIEQQITTDKLRPTLKLIRNQGWKMQDELTFGLNKNQSKKFIWLSNNNLSITYFPIHFATETKESDWIVTDVQIQIQIQI